MNTILFNHINDFNEFCKNNSSLINNDVNRTNLLTNKQRLEKQFEIFKVLMQQNCDTLNHFALSSRRNEIAYLRQMCKQAMPFLLPDTILKCRYMC